MIDYSTKTYADILEQQLARIADTLDKREGSIIMTALGPESWYLEGVYLDLQKLQNNIYVPTAVGSYLDLLAQSHAIERKEATAAVKEGIFNVQIPSGSRFSTVTEGSKPALVYFVTDVINSDIDSYTYQMQCETVGAAGNDYIGQLLAIDYVKGLTSATLGDIVIPGTEEESDDSLRSRLITKIQLPSTSGNKYDYYNWAMEVTGVGAVKVFPLADGPGTVKVVIVDSSMQSPSDTLVADVAAYIEERRPIGATVTVAAATESVINVAADITLSNGVSLTAAQTAFAAAVKSFLADQGFGLSYVSLARIGNVLLDVAGVEDYSNLLLNGTSSNISLSDTDIAVAGNVDLGVM